ncbi:MAG: hypothetical protein K0Q72_2044, partial [Armatimonadetes bacterium]|nr:hypothetical protein [Armatimonadota bacterium]
MLKLLYATDGSDEAAAALVFVQQLQLSPDDAVH